ncbi:hypothetical protein DBY21_09025 [Candidatus Gastranaerophilales bacterium]|nr:MAG: hypothetical protein DBY21_09025 [Candidatus Gastranaerophilales bacterium]
MIKITNNASKNLKQIYNYKNSDKITKISHRVTNRQVINDTINYAFDRLCKPYDPLKSKPNPFLRGMEYAFMVNEKINKTLDVALKPLKTLCEKIAKNI